MTMLKNNRGEEMKREKEEGEDLEVEELEVNMEMEGVLGIEGFVEFITGINIGGA